MYHLTYCRTGNFSETPGDHNPGVFYRLECDDEGEPITGTKIGPMARARVLADLEKFNHRRSCTISWIGPRVTIPVPPTTGQLRTLQVPL